MLAILEPLLRRLSSARSDAELTRALGEAAFAFGFRSAYLIQYAGKLASFQRALDTNPARRSWWTTFFASDLRPTPREVAAMLESAQVIRLDASRLFAPGMEKIRAAMEMWDLIDVTAVPISHGGELVGVVGFTGAVEKDKAKETALVLLAYAAYALVGTAFETEEAKSVSLTYREREVMELAAQGLTSVEIGERLKISTRTANQHVDNVSAKLGTRNRAHAVAEVIRLGLI